MAKLTRADVLRVAKLANLKLSEGEIEKYLKQLSGVVEHISQLAEVDTSNIEPTSQTTGLENIYHEDAANGENCLSQEEALAGTEKTYNGYFKVKAILTERSDK